MTTPITEITGITPRNAKRTIPLRIPKICTYGYKGDLNVGLYHCAFVSLKTITVSSLKINIKTLKALASFAIFTTSKKIIANAIREDVVRIAETGVINFELMPAK